MGFGVRRVGLVDVTTVLVLVVDLEVVVVVVSSCVVGTGRVGVVLMTGVDGSRVVRSSYSSVS